MSDLGHITQRGKLSPTNKIAAGNWVVTFPPDLMPRQMYEVWHGSLVGPGGYALLYRDDVRYGVIQNGRINEYAPSICLLVMPGQIITVHWSVATVSTTPEVTFFNRTPEVGRI